MRISDWSSDVCSSDLGLENALSRIAGMYAFALWDRRDHRLHLVRDRIGKKPLYYGWAGGALVFASELKAIAAHPRFKPEINRNALTAYLRYQYVPAPWSIWQGIYKLPPGCRLKIGRASCRERGCQYV